MTQMPEESRFVGAPSGANSRIEETAVLFAPEGAPTGGPSIFHGGNLSTERWSGAHQAYLITTVTHERKRYFEDACCARALVNALKHSDSKMLSHTHAYMVMPDHLHWLMTLGNERDLSDTVGRVKGESARHINTVLDRRGSPIWQHGFHDHALRQEEDMRDIARYVVANPLRAGLVDRIGDYPWWDAEWP